jgi:hypothetical protein
VQLVQRHPHGDAKRGGVFKVWPSPRAPHQSNEALISSPGFGRPNRLNAALVWRPARRPGGGTIESATTTKARNTNLPPGLTANARRDAWWAQPILTVLVLTGFVAYATFRVFENQLYIADNGNYHYATPFGNPDLTAFVPPFLISIPVVGQFLAYPAVLILPFVAGFRFTCYYYRKAYYRGFAATPPACAVPGTTGKKYKGEAGLFVFQNLHRYFLYAALVILAFNFYDMARSIITPHGLYFGLGSLVMIVNVALLSAYTLGCHSLRHLVGGRLDCFTCDPFRKAQYSVWGRVTMLNQRHMLWAWLSLAWVAFTDFYIRTVSLTGVDNLLGVPI